LFVGSNWVDFYMKKIIIALVICSTFLTTSASALIINFNDYTVSTFSAAGQGVGTGSVDVSLDGSTLELEGNLWRSIAVDYSVTSSTILNFEFLSTVAGEIQGIAFGSNDNPNTGNSFQLLGSQSNFGRQNFDTYILGDSWSDFSINVGDFYTGVFDRLVFIMDDDGASVPQANAFFRNIEICESGSCTQAPYALVPAPATLAFFSLGLLLISLRRIL
jgi:hypothetical protein